MIMLLDENDNVIGPVLKENKYSKRIFQISRSNKKELIFNN